MSSSKRKGVPHTRPRKRLSCEPCRASKLRCDRQHPCDSCIRRQCVDECYFSSTRVGRFGVTQLGKADSLGQIPGSEASAPQRPSPANNGDTVTPVRPLPENHLSSIGSLNGMLERPACGSVNSISELGNTVSAPYAFGPAVPVEEALGWLPPTTTREYLISRYFTYQAPLFNVIHGSTFRNQYADFVRDPKQASLPWLALLLVICSSAILTLEPNDAILKEYWPAEQHVSDHGALFASHHLRRCALACLSGSQFVVRYDLNTLEALLVMSYGICHSEGVDRGWVFLGMALNISIALRCNVERQHLDRVEQQRRRRCWAGVLMLHTYQGILFRDIDMSFLVNVSEEYPLNVCESIAMDGEIRDPTNCSSSMFLMRFKLQLFELTRQICSEIVRTPRLSEATINKYNDLIASEQEEWKAAFLPTGSPDLLNPESYAYWCILRTYAHQLNLIIHRASYYRQSPDYLPVFRDRYLRSAVDLLDVFQQICELPRLRPYRWLATGMTAFNAIQGAVALAACIIDSSSFDDSKSSHCATFDATVMLVRHLQASSPICAKAYPALYDLQTHLTETLNCEVGNSSQDFATNGDLTGTEFINWEFWDDLIHGPDM